MELSDCSTRSPFLVTRIFSLYSWAERFGFRAIDTFTDVPQPSNDRRGFGASKQDKRCRIAGPYLKSRGANPSISGKISGLQSLL